MQSLDQRDLLQTGRWGNMTDQEGDGLAAFYQQGDSRLVTGSPDINAVHLETGEEGV